MLYFGVGLNNNECKNTMSINKGSLKKVKFSTFGLTPYFLKSVTSERNNIFFLHRLLFQQKIGKK